jgi:diaphanous 1
MLALSLRHIVVCVQVGFEQVLSRSNLVTCISYCLYTSSTKLRTQVAEMLAALCVLSIIQGHRVVVAALSDFRIEHGERFRFEYLISSIRVDDPDSQERLSGYEPDEAGMWEYRTAAMALINAITNSPDDLEERISLRDEFSRRGLDEVVQVNRASAPIITLWVWRIDP